ncbi:MAG: hypothetical protein EH225_13720 [Calditrichaeota bacterium]|nr:MAG: hypothetical protein EH225_13720 [Calditrichota bacterium]
MSSENLHEKQEDLSQETLDLHRAYASIIEEIEAVDWYNQRVDATGDENLKKVLAHNRDEEVEHACMTLEWLRRNSPVWNENMKTYLFTEAPITELEEEEEHGSSGGSGSKKKELKIGKL